MCATFNLKICTRSDSVPLMKIIMFDFMLNVNATKRMKLKLTRCCWIRAKNKKMRRNKIKEFHAYLIQKFKRKKISSWNWKRKRKNTEEKTQTSSTLLLFGAQLLLHKQNVNLLSFGVCVCVFVFFFSSFHLLFCYQAWRWMRANWKKVNRNSIYRPTADGITIFNR